MIRIVLIGAGNVAQHLYKAFLKNETVEVIKCYNRKKRLLDKKQPINQVTDNIEIIKQTLADVYIVSISDDAIATVTNTLDFENKLIVHTSGSVPMKMISKTKRKGVFYPLQTFTAEKEMNYRTIPFCLEAENKQDFEILHRMATAISDKVFEINSEQRQTLHVAAVFVNNFTNYLFGIAEQICDDQQIPFEILHPLIKETAHKIQELSPKKSQTGPAIRDDHQTIQRHLGLLNDQNFKNIYNLLTQGIQKTHGKKL